jgi:hypothetical protein
MIQAPTADFNVFLPSGERNKWFLGKNFHCLFLKSSAPIPVSGPTLPRPVWRQSRPFPGFEPRRRIASHQELRSSSERRVGPGGDSIKH